MKTIGYLFLLLVVNALLLSNCNNENYDKDNPSVKLSQLREGFVTPPDSVKPSVYWYWLNGNISKKGVVKDLEAMHRVGIGRAFIGNIGLDGDMPEGNVKLFSDQWWDITDQTMKTAGRLGIDIGMFNSPGWSQSGGPWVKPNQAMRYLAKDELELKGPQPYSKKWPKPSEHFQDVAVMAFPVPGKSPKTIADDHPVVQSNVNIQNPENLVDGDTSSSVLFKHNDQPYTDVTLEIKSDESLIVRSLELDPAPSPFQADCELQVKTGQGFETVKHFTFNRSNPNKNVGFKPYGPEVITFKAVQGNIFRLNLSKIKGTAGLSEIILSEAPKVSHYISKELAKMHQTPHPMWDAYRWPDQPEIDSSWTMNPQKAINITDKLSDDDMLNWKVPEGKWRIVRFGMVPTGVNNAPAPPEGTGLEVDKMNKVPLEDHFNSFIGKILDRIPEADRKTFKYVVADSYETGSENWTDGFAKDFKQRYGYDPLPWLPVLSGQIVSGADESNRFLWDLRRLIADRIAYQYVGGLRELSHQHGLKIWLENYGHWGFPAEFLQYGGQTDEVAGEFWAEGDLGSIELRDASSAAHIYGKNKVAAESFTAAGKPFVRNPASIKQRGDWAFAQGVNHTLLHVYIEQPYEDKNPGMNAWFGTEFNRKNTWFDQSKMFFDYLRRNMFMLQQGNSVADVLYFIGENAPVMTGIQKPALPDGYDFDYINAEVIKNRLKVKDGKLVLPDGLSYRLLVLPPTQKMRPETLQKIKELVDQGAAVLGTPPEKSPSLENYPQADQQVQQMADELWGKVDGRNVKVAHYGKGLILSGLTMQEALDQLKVKPDFEVPSSEPVLYKHRKLADKEIYFVTNQGDTTVHISPIFRTSGKHPEFWNPVTGKTRKLPQYSEQGQTTQVPLKLKPAQSGFVVFVGPDSEAASDQNGENFPEPREIAQIKGPWKVQFDTSRGGPQKSVIFDKLMDWSQNKNDRIKYYSGTAIYTNSFEVPKVSGGSHLYLNLGKVAVMAKVSINGQRVGGVWTPPRRVDITNAIHAGKNQLKVEVVNTWVNRLIGDSRLPKGQRLTWAAVNSYKPDSPLVSAGLLGPVTLQKIDNLN